MEVLKGRLEVDDADFAGLPNVKLHCIITS